MGMARIVVVEDENVSREHLNTMECAANSISRCVVSGKPATRRRYSSAS